MMWKPVAQLWRGLRGRAVVREQRAVMARPMERRNMVPAVSDERRLV
jgi:hypothetical protein